MLPVQQGCWLSNMFYFIIVSWWCITYTHITPINPLNDSWTFLFIIWGLSGGPGKRISSKAVIRNGLLTIPSVDRSDEGEYICKALNTHGEHTARGVLHVQSTCPAQKYFKIYSVPSSRTWRVSSSLLFNWCFRYRSTSRSAHCTSKPSAGGTSWGWDFTVVLQGRWQSNPCPYMEEERWFTAATGEKPISPVVIYPVTQWGFLGLWHWSYFALVFFLLWVFLSVSSRVLVFVQAIPSHGFHQFKSNSLDVLQRRIEELQVCPSVWCLSHASHPTCLASLTLTRIYVN